MPRKIPVALSFGIAWGLSPLAAMAQSSPSVLPEVVSSGSRDAQVERRTAPSQKTVYEKDVVQRYDDGSVGDVLRRLPGITFSGPAGTPATIRLRGMGAGYTQILINGEPVAGAAADRQMQIDRLPAHLIERIEINPNPTAEQESSGVAGSINIVLKSKADNRTHLGVAYGKTGAVDTGNASAQWSHSNGKLDAVAGLSHTVSAEDQVDEMVTFNAAGDRTQVERKPRTVSKGETLFAPRVALPLGSGRLTLDPFVTRGTEHRVGPSVTTNAAGAVTRKLTQDVEDRADLIARLSGRYDGETPWGTWYTKLGVQQGQTERDKRTTLASAADVVTQRTHETDRTQEDQRYVGAGLELPMGAHLLKAGLEYRDTAFGRDYSYRSATDSVSPLAQRAPGAGDIYDVSERRQVAYLMDEWRVSDAHWLIPGVRLENFDRAATDRNGATSNAAYLVPLPSLHYRWAADTNTNLRASVAQSLKNPTFADLNPLVTLATTGLNPGSLTNPDAAGNAALRPERSTGIEAGIERFFWGDRGVVGLNAYGRDVTDFIETVAMDEGGRYVNRPRNVGRARFYGVTLDARLPLVQRGDQELTLTGSHSELRGEVTNAKNVVTAVRDLAPRVSNLGLDWRHRPSQWSAGFALNHVPTYTVASTAITGIKSNFTRPEATLLDLYVGKSFGPSSELRLMAKNLLSVVGGGTTINYKPDGSFDSSSGKFENSRPSVMLSYQLSF